MASAEPKVISGASASYYRQELQTNINRKTNKKLTAGERQYRVTKLHERSQTLHIRYRKDEDQGVAGQNSEETVYSF